MPTETTTAKAAKKPPMNIMVSMVRFALWFMAEDFELLLGQEYFAALL
jgi:hypothetical protein